MYAYASSLVGHPTSTDLMPLCFSGVFVVTLILLVCVPGVRRRVPLNYVCLAIFV